MKATISKANTPITQYLDKYSLPGYMWDDMAEPEEVANLVTFVCSPLSSATNGAALRADGGVVRSII